MLSALAAAAACAGRAQCAAASSPMLMAAQRRHGTEYLAARAAFKAEVEGYWTSIAEKRRGRNAKRRERQQITLDDYVLTQPPVYHGPSRPPGPSPEPVPESKPRVAKPIPVVTDLVAAASQVYQWTPQRPANEMDFKRAYARYALNAGLTRAAGGPRLCVRDRRQRHARVAIRLSQRPRDLDRDRLQPAAHHQHRRADRRAGRGVRQGAEGEGALAVGPARAGDGAQDRGAEEDGGAGDVGAGRMGAAREDRRHAAGLGDARHGARHRRRPDAADPQAPDLGDLRPRTRATRGR